LRTVNACAPVQRAQPVPTLQPQSLYATTLKPHATSPSVFQEPKTLPVYTNFEPSSPFESFTEKTHIFHLKHRHLKAGLCCLCLYDAAKQTKMHEY
jgi:hypothetical protein